MISVPAEASLQEGIANVLSFINLNPLPFPIFNRRLKKLLPIALFKYHAKAVYLAFQFIFSWLQQGGINLIRNNLSCKAGISRETGNFPAR